MNHSRLLRQSIAAICFALVATVPASAQELPEKVLLDIQAGRFDQARRALEAGGETPAPPNVRHVAAILDLALGKAGAAERQYASLVEGDIPPAGVGPLGESVVAGSALHSALRRYRPVVATGVGAAAFWNNLGVCRLLTGRPAEASAAFDRAAAEAQDWGVPWINGALAALDQGKGQQAEVAARTAIQLGERSSRAYAVKAMANISVNQLDRAADDLDRCFDLDAEDPYGLAALAALKRLRASGRESERALWQALAAAKEVLVDSNLDPAAGRGFGVGGGASELHLQGTHHGYQPSLAYKFAFQANRLRVEDRSSADQRQELYEAGIASSAGTFFGSSRSVFGGRPGGTTTEVGIAPTPEADFWLYNAIYGWIGKFDDLTLHASYRRTSTFIQMDSMSSKSRQVSDRQWLAEARYDKGPWMFGVAASRVDRKASSARAIEPVEDVLPSGVTEYETLYALRRMKLGENSVLRFGGFLSRADGKVRGSFVGDLNVNLVGGKSMRIGAKTRLNEAATNLFPSDLVAPSPQTNEIDRRMLSAHDFNRDPVLVGRDGRSDALELTLLGSESDRHRLETFLFHKRMHEVRTQAADSRVASALLLTPVGRGEALGLGERLVWRIGDTWTVRAQASVQTTRGRIDTPTLDADAYPASVSKSTNRIPDFPTFQAGLALEYGSGRWTTGAVINHIGSRLRAVTTTGLSGLATYLSEASPTTSINLFTGWRQNDDNYLSVFLFNATGTSFYPGYGGRPTFAFAYEYRY